MATTTASHLVEPRSEFCLSLDFRDYHRVDSITVQQGAGPTLLLRSLYVDGEPVPWAPVNTRPTPTIDFSELGLLDLEANPDIEGDFLTVVVFNPSAVVTVSAQIVVDSTERPRPPDKPRPPRFGDRPRPAASTP